MTSDRSLDADLVAEQINARRGWSREQIEEESMLNHFTARPQDINPLNPAHEKYVGLIPKLSSVSGSPSIEQFDDHNYCDF